MAQRPGRKRLSIDVPNKIHETLIKISKQRNITLTKYVLRALVRYSLYEAKYEEYTDIFDAYK